jgi:hypothetical protein
LIFRKQGGNGMVRVASPRSEIEYAVVALDISPRKLAEIIRDVTGLSVDTKAKGFLLFFTTSQLNAIWKRLSEHPGWSIRTQH